MCKKGETCNNYKRQSVDMQDIVLLALECLIILLTGHLKVTSSIGLCSRSVMESETAWNQLGHCPVLEDSG